MWIVADRKGPLNEDSPNGERILTDPAHDVLAAVRYVAKEAVTLGADAANIGLSGSSAGGITVAHALILDFGEGDSGSAGFPSNATFGISQSGGISNFMMAHTTLSVCFLCFCCILF